MMAFWENMYQCHGAGSGVVGERAETVLKRVSCLGGGGCCDVWFVSSSGCNCKVGVNVYLEMGP